MASRAGSNLLRRTIVPQGLRGRALVAASFGSHSPQAAAAAWFRYPQELSRASTRRYLSDDTKTSSSENTPIPEIDRSTYTQEVPVRMPDMGEGKGKILKWYKEEGDIVQRRDILCDIETDDFTFGMETDDEDVAIMGKILVKAPFWEVTTVM